MMYDKAVSIGDKVIECAGANIAISRFNHWMYMQRESIEIVSFFGTWANDKFIIRVKYEVL